jgi:hypothetical protein
VERRARFEKIHLAPQDHPGFLQLPMLAAPGLLADREPKLSVDVVGVETIGFGRAPSEIAAELQANALR